MHLILLSKDGGMYLTRILRVKIQNPVAPALEVAFPDLVFDKKVSIFDKEVMVI